MPKIVRFHQFGGPEVLKVEELPSQQPGPNEVRLRVQALGLNRAESMFYHGRYLEAAEFPARLGYEAAGIVAAVGAGVDTSWIGKHVAIIPGFLMTRYGMLGEEALAPVTMLGEYPDNLSPAQAAAIWMQYLTAWGALVHFGRVGSGDVVVITAASSSVGLAAIEIVKDTGGVAIAATRSSKKRDELLSLGADHVIATEEEDIAAKVNEITGGKGARIIFDPIGGSFVEKLAAAVAYHGTVFEYGALAEEPTPFPLFTALGKGLAFRGYTLREITADLQLLDVGKKYIYDRLASGKFSPRIARVFPFSQIVEAYQYLESNTQIGKVVVTLE